MILWTRQVVDAYKELDDCGVYAVREEYIREKNDTISDYYLELYRWYTKAARQYIDIDEERLYPIWLSVDEQMMLQGTPGTVILKLDVPEEKVLLCNDVAWGYRMNYWYVPLDETDEKAHNEELQRYGIASEADLTLTSKGNFYPLLKKKIESSWQRIFTQAPKKPEEYVATMWEIKKEWVKEVRVCE